LQKESRALENGINGWIHDGGKTNGKGDNLNVTRVLWILGKKAFLE
jgi:hypothetical protein